MQAARSERLAVRMTRPALTVVPDASARLRVITAGDVGNVESRLGSSGFDVVAVVDTEADLIVAVGNGDPDAIVVEADLCETLEPVRELAPDAAIIVIGDRTPAGALGHIDRGVTGTVLARLIQALAAGGVAAVAAVPGFTPAPAPRLARLSHHGGHALAAGTAGTVVAAAVAVMILGGASPAPESTDVIPSTPPSVSAAPLLPPASIPPSDVASPADQSPKTPAPPVVAVPRQAIDVRPDTPPSAPNEGPADDSPPQEGPSPPDGSPPPTDTEGTHPPGHAKGWENKPPKHDDNGQHEGWTQGNGPKD